MILTAIPIHNNEIDWPGWIQASASIAAAIGLVWTLILQKRATDAQVLATKEQIEINKVQIQMANRDEKRFKLEIRPQIKFEFEYSTYTQTGRFRYYTLKNDAFRFVVESRCTDAIRIKSGLYLPTDLAMEEVRYIEFEILDLERLQNWVPNHAPFIFVLYFEDINDNKYKTIGIKYLDDEPMIFNTPEEISEETPYVKKIVAKAVEDYKIENS